MEAISTAAMARHSWWVLSFPLAAKCGLTTATALNLLFLALVFVLLRLVAGLVCWTSPGGHAWGKYWWTRGLLRHVSSSYTAIPGPRGLPFLGSMGLMSGLAHRHLALAAKNLGAERLMAFSIGESRAVVTADPEVAREILNSSSFVDRPAKESAYKLMFHRSIGFAPYGVYWRTLRKIAATHLFCPRHLSLSEPQRFEIAAEMVHAVEKLQHGHGQVRARDVMKLAALNNMMRSVFGKKYVIGSDEGVEEVEELRSLVDEGYDLLGQLDWSDHLPLLSSFDLQGIRSRCSTMVPRVNRFVNNIINEHRASGSNATAGHTPGFVDALLTLQSSENLSDQDIVAVLWEMIFRGTDTVAVLMEWMMARMVLHPEIQVKAQEELDRVVGRSRPVTEPDMAALVYIQAAVRETLRMHPPGPLLSWARLSTWDTVVDGHQVPAGTTGMVNMWAITHDPDVWEKPSEFRPERFLAKEGGVELSVFGSDLRLAPFGSGKRSCPGMAMGMTTVGFWMATLLHEFEWESLPSDDRTRGGVDLSEVLRLTCEMKVPLAVKVRRRRM